MNVRIKLCGMTRADDARAAVDLGADAVGLIFYPASPRYVEIDQAQTIVESLPISVATVAVLVEPSIPLVHDIEQSMRIDAWQIHGQVCSDFIFQMRPRKIIRAVGLPMHDSSIELHPDSVHAYLLDKASTQHGGTGKTFDWSLANEWKQRFSHPLILAGGLSPLNVAQAIEAVQPYAVDVSSGIESTPGIKDHAKMRSFVQACRAHDLCHPLPFL